MTDAEVICTWMEPDAPENGGRAGIDVLKKYSPNGWWRYCMLSCIWKRPILVACDDPRILLGLLHEVEERLTDEQWYRYTAALPTGKWWSKELVHATAEQKIKALAAVLRPIVEGGTPNAE